MCVHVCVRVRVCVCVLKRHKIFRNFFTTNEDKKTTDKGVF